MLILTRRRYMTKFENTLEVSPTTINIAADGTGTYNIQVVSNTTWNIKIT